MRAVFERLPEACVVLPASAARPSKNGQGLARVMAFASEKFAA